MSNILIMKRVFIFSVVLLLISCNNQTSKPTNKKQANDNLEFQNNYQNSPKLFSKFWIDMTERDFRRVVDTLKKQRKIIQKSDSLFYELDGYEIYLTRKFENGKLKKISLTGKIEPYGQILKFSPYHLFQEKYNLPNLVNKPKYFQKGTIPNPEFEPTYQVYLRNGITENVPNYLIDSKPKKYRYQLKENEQITRLGIKEPIEIDRDEKTKIYIKEIPSQNDSRNEDVVYSLEDWENEIPFAIKTKYSVGRHQIGIIADDYKTFNDQKSMETIGNYLVRKNSKYITKSLYQNYDLQVVYTTKEYHISEQKRLNDKNNNEKELRDKINELNQKANEERKKGALEDI